MSEPRASDRTLDSSPAERSLHPATEAVVRTAAYSIAVVALRWSSLPSAMQLCSSYEKFDEKQAVI